MAGPVFHLPLNLRKLPMAERREKLRAIPGLEPEELAATAGAEEMLDLADVMVEAAVGLLPVPIGVATGMLIDGALYDVPLAVEEPSVVAAATYAGRLTRASGGIETWATDPIMTAQVYVEGARPDAAASIAAARAEIVALVHAALPSLEARGGGLREIETRGLAVTGLLRVDLHIDVRDAMGANILDTAAEAVRGRLEAVTGGRTLMSIITNAAARRLAGARLSVRVADLATDRITGGEVAARIDLASRLAQEDPERAVTHNKGIMNAVSGLALATGNDTRAVEAAAHLHACRRGSYRGLSEYRLSGGRLEGRLEMPLPLAVVGGGVSINPAARLALKLLGSPDATGLSRIAAAVGLAQSLAALRALVTEGIQKGHMRHQAYRIAWLAGARGPEIRRLADRLAAESTFASARAAELLAEMRRT